MTIHNISNYTDLFSTLDLCSCNLTLITPDGKAYDFAQQRDFMQSLLNCKTMPKWDKMVVKFDGEEDISRILCYLIECERG